MDTPVQTAAVPAAAGAEPGVASASGAEGASFLMDQMGAAFADAPQQVPPQQVPPQQVPPQQVPPQQVPPQQVPPQQVPPQQVPPQQVLPQQVPPQQAVDFAARYAGQQPVDPLAGLTTAPDLAPEPVIAQPQNMDVQQNHAWAALRAQATANRRAAEDYRVKYNQLVESTKKFQEERTGFGEQLNSKDAEIQRLQDELGRLDLTRSQAFRDKYDAPILGVRAEAAKALEANGYAAQDADALARDILSADPKERPALMRELPTHLQGILMIKAGESDSLFDARDAAISDWRTSSEGLAAAEQRGSAFVNAQHVDKMVEGALNVLRTMPPGSVPPAYQVTDPVFAADRDAKEKQFRAWVQQAPEEQRYAAMLEGFMAPKTYEMLEQTMLENQRLRAALASHGRLSAPPVHGGAPAPVVLAQPPPPKPPTVAENGYSEAPAAPMAQDFVRQMFPGFPG